jgi:[acyl-carrier-protein] S-malonyltransferase
VSSARSAIAFVFPGQASQRAGMAAELLEREPTARDIFGRAGEILGLDLAGVCTTGNDALLTRTDIAQPALLTTCVAWLAAVRSRGLDATVLAGHSLGEFTAWVGSGAIEFEAALRLVRRRGEIMEEAAQRNPGGMIAVIGLPDDSVTEICTQAESIGTVVPANFNSPGQLVVSGTPDALDRVAELAKAAGGRAMPLRVAGAFHSPLMDDAAREFSRLVAAVAIADPRIPVVANVSAEPVTDADSVRSAMSRQMTSPVLWTASVHRMVADGVSLFLEVGPGKVLTNLIRRISTDARTAAVGSLDALETLSQEANP